MSGTPERIARIEDERPFQNLAKSRKRPGLAHDAEVVEGQERQEAIRTLLGSLAEKTGGEVVRPRGVRRDAERRGQGRRSAPLRAQRKVIRAALGERDPEAVIWHDRHGNPEPDTELRDTETVPLREDVDEYIGGEVLPHVPDAWVDERKTKVGYEIPLNRHFYVYELARPL